MEAQKPQINFKLEPDVFRDIQDLQRQLDLPRTRVANWLLREGLERVRQSGELHVKVELGKPLAGVSIAKQSPALSTSVPESTGSEPGAGSKAARKRKRAKS
jgi:hypothetical protein